MYVPAEQLPHWPLERYFPAGQTRGVVAGAAVVLVVAAFVVVPVKTHADPDLAYPALHWKGHAVAVVTGLAGPVKYALGMAVQLAAVTHPAAQFQ